MRRVERLRATLVVAAALLYTGPARGTEIRDGAEFSFAVPNEANPCFVFPQTFFDRAACPADAKPLATVPVNGHSSTLAVASAALDDGGRVMLVATRFERGELEMPSDLMAFARGMADQMANGRPGARTHGTPQASLVEVDGVSLVRASFDVDGFYQDGSAHQVSYAVWAQGAAYVISLSGLTSSASAIDAMGYRLVAAMHVARPSPYKPVSRSYRLGVLTGRVLVPGLAIVALVVFFWRDRRKRLRGAGT